MPRAAGVELTPLHPGLQISLSGTQPDRCELLAQWVPIGSAGAQVLRYRSVASGLTADSGVHWRITASAGVDLSDSARLKLHPDIYDQSPAESFLGFQGPPTRNPGQAALIRIALVYERAPGAVPTRGWIRLEKVWLTK